jgi:ABC-type glycerol-3-phosphate transport system substrate-binding protein
MKKIFFTLISLVAAGAVFAACSSSAPQATPTPTPDTTSERLNQEYKAVQNEVKTDISLDTVPGSTSDEIADLEKDAGSIKLENETFQ